MNLRRLITGTLLSVSPALHAELADIPSGCSTFDYRNLQPYYITTADQFASGYQLAPTPEQRTNGLGNVIFTTTDAYRNQYHLSADEVTNTEVLYTIHLLGEGQYCPIHVGKNWLEKDGQYALLDDDTAAQLTKLLTWRRDRNRDAHEDPNIYHAVEPGIRAMLSKEWVQPVQDWYADQQAATSVSAENPETEDTPEATETSENAKTTASTTTPEDQWHNRNDTKNNDPASSRMMNFPPLKPQTDQREKQQTPTSYGWVFQSIMATLVLGVLGIIGILWKIFRQGL